MKKINAAIIVGLAAGAGFGLYEIIKNEKVRSKTAAVVTAASNMAADTGFAVAEGVRSAVRKECTVKDAIINTAMLAKDMIKDNVDECKENLSVIDEVFGLDDAETEAADRFADAVINKTETPTDAGEVSDEEFQRLADAAAEEVVTAVDAELEHLVEDVEADIMPEIDAEIEAELAEMEESMGLDDEDFEVDVEDDIEDTDLEIDETVVEADESEAFAEEELEESEQEAVVEQSDADVEVPAITEEQFIEKVENENGDELKFVVLESDENSEEIEDITDNSEGIAE